MEAKQAETYHLSADEPSDNADRVILRAIVGDPNRHKPLAEHTPPSTKTPTEGDLEPMYTIEPRNRKIPEKVLPKKIQVKVEYLEPKKVEPASPVRQTPVAAEEEPVPEASKAVLPEPVIVPVSFLEPEIIQEPVLYSIVTENTPQNDEPVPTAEEPTSPIFYAIIGQSHQPNIVASPIVPPEVEQPIQSTPEVEQPTSPSLFPLVGSPKVTSPVIEKTTLDETPPVEPVRRESYDVEPVLLTVVADKKKPTPKPKADRPLPTLVPIPVRKPTTQPSIYAAIGNPKAPSPKTVERKIPTLPPIKPQSKIPTLYATVGKPKPASADSISSILKKTPSTESRPEQETEPELLFEKIPPIKKHKHKREAESQERRIPKSETTFIPLQEHDPDSFKYLPEVSRGRLRHLQCIIPYYDPFRASNYVSPYAYHPSKQYREKTYDGKTLPPLKNGSERRTRAGYYTTSHGTRKHPYNPWTAHSLERHSTGPKQQSRRWDFENHPQTDVDDDANEERLTRLKQKYRRFRPRTPWVPVW